MAWIVARPLVSHAVIAAAMTLIVFAGLKLGGAPWPAIVAGIVTATFMFGREAGQVEHDRKRQGVSPVRAWLGAYTMTGWGMGNIAQWLAPALVTAVIVAALWHFEV